MINILISDIKNYIKHLEKKKIYVSIHTYFTEYMLSLLEFNIHKNPVCLRVKSSNDAWDKCIKVHNSEVEKSEEPIIRICHAGVKEFVFYLDCGGTVCISTSKKYAESTVKTIVSPLCRMIEYLKLLCPECESDISDNELVNRAIKFIQRNFYNKISNEDIASACACSVSTLCHLFKQFKSSTVKQYITALRINYAKELLRTSNLSVSSIADKSGFSDYNYFSTKFKKETGKSPSEYRECPIVSKIKQ